MYVLLSRILAARTEQPQKPSQKAYQYDSRVFHGRSPYLPHRTKCTKYFRHPANLQTRYVKHCAYRFVLFGLIKLSYCYIPCLRYPIVCVQVLQYDISTAPLVLTKCKRLEELSAVTLTRRQTREVLCFYIHYIV